MFLAAMEKTPGTMRRKEKSHFLTGTLIS